jgi:methyl-accepting chemotaxis protein
MSIMRRIFLGYLLLAVIIVSFAAAFGIGVLLVYNESQKSRDQATELVDRTTTVSDLVDRSIADSLAAAMAGGRESGGAGEPQAGTAEIDAALADLQSLAWDTGTKNAAEELRNKADGFLRQAASIATMRQEDVSQALIDLPMQGALSRDAAEALVDAAHAAAAAKTADAKKAAQRFETLMLLGFSVGAVIALLFAFLQPRSIARRLRGVVDELSTAAAETLAVASQVSSGALQTATAVSEAATTIDEVRQTTLHTSEKASGVAESARNADGIAESGRTAVARASERMGGIHDQMAMLAESVASLTDQTEAASDIVATINDISEQSRLLSVNASIEAVKASEEGRGFGVVAEEIKHLSLQSKQGVISVRTVLNEIQKAMAAAVMSAEQSGRAIELGVDETRDLRDAIEALADSVGLAAQSAMQIEASAQQELVGMDQISDAMSSIDQASAQNAAGAGQLEEEAGHLRDLAWRLEHLISARGSNRGGSGDGFDADSGAGTASDSVE